MKRLLSEMKKTTIELLLIGLVVILTVCGRLSVQSSLSSEDFSNDAWLEYLSPETDRTVGWVKQ